MSNDYIYRTTAFYDQVRVLVANTRDMANEAVRLHQTGPVAAAALTRVLTAASMLGSLLKNDSDLLSLIIKCEGPVGAIVATANSLADVKGYVRGTECEVPLKPNGKIDLRTAVGAGTLTLVRDMGLKEPYSGQIELVSGEIADDLTYYFAKSEQIPTSIALGELIDADGSIVVCGGLLIQLLPGAEDWIAGEIQNELIALPPLSELLAAGETPEDIAGRIFGKHELAIGERLPLRYNCGCSKEKMEQALVSIGKQDIEKIISEDGKAELHCHFCNKRYIFSREELISLSKKI